MTWVSDATLRHLCDLADLPDLPADGRYELVDLLGRGGMGVVYLARDRMLDRMVAVKVLATELVGADSAARLEREARILARLEHPGIVPIHDVGVLQDGRVFYVMKRVQGPRLDSQTITGRPLGERLAMFLRVCEPVAFAHAHGIVHRDLKPENIMVGPFGEVLILDWGVAKVVSDPGQPSRDEPHAKASGAGHTAHGTVLGTPGYMAPEQARGESTVGPAADVYALGGILQFLISGRPPDAAAAIGPRPLRAIVARSRDDAPGDRYPDAEALRADVRRFVAGEAVEAYPEGPVGRAMRLLQKHQAAVWLVVAYLFMRVVLLLFTR